MVIICIKLNLIYSYLQDFLSFVVKKETDVERAETEQCPEQVMGTNLIIKLNFNPELTCQVGQCHVPLLNTVKPCYNTHQGTA